MVLVFVLVDLQCQRPTSFSHLILVPSTDRKWIEKHKDWVLNTNAEPDGRLTVDLDSCIRLSKKNSSFDFKKLRREFMEVPIYYRSWQQLHESFEKAMKKYDDFKNEKHWQNIVAEIGVLSRTAGRFS